MKSCSKFLRNLVTTLHFTERNWISKSVYYYCMHQNNLCNNAFNLFITNIPANIYMFKVNNRNTRKRYEICLELTIKTPERHHWRRAGVFIVNFAHISHLFLVFLLLNLNKWMLVGILSYKNTKLYCKSTDWFLYNKNIKA